MTHLFDVPADCRPLLAHHGWGEDGAGCRLSLDDLELAGRLFSGPSGAPIRNWADRILSAVNATMPATSGTAYLDDESHIIGIGLVSGVVAGAMSDEVVPIDREDACFALRAFEEGYTRVRPMGEPPVAVLSTTTLLAAAPAEEPADSPGVDVPDGAKVFIEVDPDNKSIVYDVWAVAPTGGSTVTSGVGIWRRHDGRWEPDPGFFETLQSEAPPTLLFMPNDAAGLPSVLSQVDESTSGQAFEPITASGNQFDPGFYVDLLPLIAAGKRRSLAKQAGVGKGGNAETLRRYWAEGKGAAKIRWGQGGDWYRCVSHLKKYMGTRSKGYCNLLHKRALGYYPATHAKMIRDAKKR